MFFLFVRVVQWIESVLQVQWANSAQGLTAANQHLKLGTIGQLQQKHRDSKQVAIDVMKNHWLVGDSSSLHITCQYMT